MCKKASSVVDPKGFLNPYPTFQFVSGSKWFFLIFLITILPLYSCLLSVLGCSLWRDISILEENIFHKKDFIFLNWAFLLRNCQILPFFKSSFTSNSFRIRLLLNLRVRQDPDPQHCKKESLCVPRHIGTNNNKKCNAHSGAKKDCLIRT
jgi:hypothetical protein